MRLDLVLCERVAYSYEGYSSRQVAAVLEKKNIPFQMIYLADGVLNDYLHYLKEDPPSYMLSFINLFPYEHPFCDVVRVPQFFWTQHSVSEAAHYLNSEYGKIGLPYACDLQNTVYLPHGVEFFKPQERYFDTVIFSALIDLNCLEKMWEDSFPIEMLRMIKAALATNLPPYEAIRSTLEDHSRPAGLNHLLNAVETYQKAKRTYDVITTFEGGCLDVFGEHIGNNWLKRLPNAHNVRLHYKLPYIEYLAVLNRSKQVIIDPLEPHWVLPALAAGCNLPDYELENLPPQSFEKQTEQLLEYLHEN